MSFRILRAGHADWSVVRSIRLRSLADSPDAFARTLAEELPLSDEKWRSRIDNDRVAHFLAMTSDGDSVGIAVGAPHKGQKNTAGLFAMWVAAEARGRGIGSALVEAVVDWAQSERYQRIVLDVGKTNAPAVRLYESCGFVPTGKTSALPPPRQQIGEQQWEKLLG